MQEPSQKAGSQPMLWGYPLAFWDSLGFWLMIAGAAVGGFALLVTLASSIILYRVTNEQQGQIASEARASAERTARLENETTVARLRYEQLKKEVAWRELDHFAAQRLAQELAKQPS